MAFDCRIDALCRECCEACREILGGPAACRARENNAIDTTLTRGFGEIGFDRFFSGCATAEGTNVGHAQQAVCISEPRAQRAADRPGCAGDEDAFVSSSHVGPRLTSASTVRTPS